MFKVLKSKSQILDARAELKKRGLSHTSNIITSWLRERKIIAGVNIGDVRKSWDIKAAHDLIESVLPLDAPILDIGAYSSEILSCLHVAGYSNLTGIDLNPNLRSMPYSNKIQWIEGDFFNVPRSNESYSAITAISVIEHGFDADRLLAEVSRLLKSDGLFVATFDYWPEKIHTDGVNIFDMSWTIFSSEEMKTFFDRSKKYGLYPFGDTNFEAGDVIIKMGKYHYTFGMLALQKR